MRLAIVSALEALEVGDQQLAVEILLGALEDGNVCDPHGRRRPCPVCGPPPRWPGELAAHCIALHPQFIDQRDALPEAA